ncbi:uncharacterized histidine-rich protein DDB_G0274557-like [Zerene cesonia]|uniref:uncharacterized histidine-rich protein DDB_G0274557-like n=1 Tax=Zerene cesonia TaxID=33412 RepID=UPI0018E51DD0|nr:uncharacterized histidine-rich protein DDB_G0274557-like [Zerene cesonia]
MIKLLLFTVVIVAGVVSAKEQVAQPSQHYESTDYIRHYEPYSYPVHHDRRDNRHDRHHHDRDRDHSHRHRGHDDRHHRDRHDHRDRHEYIPYHPHTPYVVPKVEVNYLNHGLGHNSYSRSGQYHDNHVSIVPKPYVPPVHHTPYVERNYATPNYGNSHYSYPYAERKYENNYGYSYPARDYIPVKEPEVEPYYYNPYGVSSYDYRGYDSYY